MKVSNSDCKAAPVDLPTRAFRGANLVGNSQLVYRIIRLAALGLVCVFLIPTAFFVQPGFGQEDSWRLALNKAFSDGWSFGDQVIWTYGPLGFLEARFPFGIPPFYYACFDVLVVVLFLRLALDSARLEFDRWLALACLASLFIVKKLISDMPSCTTFCLVILLLLQNLRRPSVVTSGLLVFVSTLMFFFKMNFGFVGVVLCILIFLCKTFERNRGAYLWLAIVLLQVLALWILAPRLHVNLVSYVKYGLVVIRHYNDSHAVGPVPLFPFHLGTLLELPLHWTVVLFAVAYIALFVSLCRKEGRSAETLLYGAIGGAVTFVLYKNAIIGSTYHHHKTFVFGFPIAALAFLVYVPTGLRKAWRTLFLSSVALACGVLLLEHGLVYVKALLRETRTRGLSAHPLAADIKAFLPIKYIMGLGTYPRTADWKTYTDWVEKFYPERSVPEDIRRIVGTNSVDVFPFEATLALGSGLKYQPRPFLQDYFPMCKELEDRNVAFFQSERAPRFVFYVLGPAAFSNMGRYHLWDEPAAKRLLQQNYVARLVFTNLQGSAVETKPMPSPVLVLERDLSAPQLQPVPLTNTTEEAGIEISVPEHDGELFATIKVRKTLAGRLISLLYRGAPVTARFVLDGGSQKQFRVLPGNLESGVLVNYFVDGEDAESMRNYLCSHSRGNLKCLKLRIDYGHSWEYQRKFAVAYFYLRAAKQ